MQEEVIYKETDWQSALRDNRRTPILDQVSFRIDFPAWFNQLSQRQREIARKLAFSYPVKEIARRYRLTAGRISQIRTELRESWEAFTADSPAKSHAIDFAA